MKVEVGSDRLVSFIGGGLHEQRPIWPAGVCRACPGWHGVAFVAAVWYYRNARTPGDHLGIFALMPLHPILTHWSDNEQRDHWFGYWFGHDMFTPPFQTPTTNRSIPRWPRTPSCSAGPTRAVLPHLHDLLRELHPARAASRPRTRNLTGATFTSLPRTPWRTAPTSTTSAPTTTAARRSIRPSSRRPCAGFSATPRTKPICLPTPRSRWTAGSPAWASVSKNGAGLIPPGLRRATLPTCPPSPLASAPDLARTPVSKCLYDTLAPATRQRLAGKTDETACGAPWPRT